MSPQANILVAVVAMTAAFAPATPQISRGYEFPADAEAYLSEPLNTEFSCQGLDYGYYADVNNNCQVFHVCWPVVSDLGEVVEYAQWSFICGNATVFDQGTLTCNHPRDSVPCQQAPSLYGAIEFGKVQQNQ